jgi:hypothetical protein
MAIRLKAQGQARQSGADPFSRQFAGWNGDHEEDVRVVDREEDSGED